MTQSAFDIQSLLVSFGTAPVDPALPSASGMRSAMECLRIARATDAYKALDAELRAGRLDRPEFFKRVSALVEKMDQDGLFGEYGSAKA